MPKIIENLRENLLLEARRQMEEKGYSAMTIRSVASACGVGTGTVYNYFSSKEELIAGFMLEDWLLCMSRIKETAMQAISGRVVAESIYRELQHFMKKHEEMFQDAGAAAAFSGTSGKYHGILRSQLARPLLPFCANAFEAEFVAEGLLTWSVAGKDFEAVYEIVKKIMKA